MIHFTHTVFGDQIGKAANYRWNPLSDIVISRLANGALAGGVIYSEYTGRTIQAHIAGFKPNWLSRSLLYAMFTYPFVQLECESILLQIKASNGKALDFAMRLGFNEETRIKDVFRDGDLVIMRMYRHECRYINGAASG